MEPIKFSVIIPLYNKGKEINRAVISVLKQSYNDFEIIVINDGSTDEGPGKVEEIAKNNHKIRIIHQSNAGVSAARNKGIELANNMFVAFLDADDEWCHDFLKKVADIILCFPKAGAYATSYRIIQSNGKTRIPKFKGIPCDHRQCLLPRYFNSALGEPPVWTSAVVVKKTVLEKVGMFPVGISMAEDKEVWERIALDFEVAFSWYQGAIYHQMADNRLCNTEYRKVYNRPFIQYAINRIKNNTINQDIITDLREYIAYCCLAMARKNLFYNGDKIKARSYLKLACSQSYFLKIKIVLLTIISFLPKRTIIKLYKIKKFVRDIWLCF